MANETKHFNGIDLQNQKVINVADPSASTDVATKQYVDNLVNGKSYKQSVRAATTTNGALATAYENGDVIDGVTLATGDRILIKDQTTGSENGVYTVNATGAPTRATDFDTGSEVRAAAVRVEQGTVNGDKEYVLTTDNVTIGTTALVFVQAGGGTPLTASLGVQRVGDDFRANVDGTTLVLAGNVLSASRTGLGATGKYAQDTGAMSAGTPLTITHNLNTTDVQVFIYLKSTGEQVDLGAKVTGVNTITVVSATAQSSGAFRVVVVG